MKNVIQNNKILIAPLNWGLGHATRCIPVINALLQEGFQPVLAGDGDSLELLKKEFPQLKSYPLPSYEIRYTKNGKFLKYKLLIDLPGIQKVIKKERLAVEKIIEKEHISGIISDNRFGVFSDKVPSVYITHQVNVLSGLTTFFTSKFHQKIISKYDECWVPDYRGENSLAGKLSQADLPGLNLKYIGPLSRFNNEIPPKEGRINNIKYDIMVLLSGPEPQRTLLEEKLLKELKDYPEKVLFVRGVISDKKESELKNTENSNIKIVNYLLQDELQEAVAGSEIIVSRSGYSTIMDLSAMQARAFFIPTPGQEEQEYLAKYLERQKTAPFASQKDFKLDLLEKISKYSGFQSRNTSEENRNHYPFDIFQRE